MDEDEVSEDLVSEMQKVIGKSKNDNNNNDNDNTIDYIVNYILNALQQKGTTTEWIEVIRANDFEFADYLIDLIISNNKDNNIVDIASKCLAFAANIYPNIWVDYILDNEALRKVLLIIENIINHTESKIHSIEKIPKLDAVPYVGFDSRDIKDFNLEGYDEYSDEFKRINKKTSSHGLVGLEEVSDTQAAILVRLLVLTQIFLKPIPFLEDLIVQHRFLLEDANAADTSNDINTVFTVLKSESSEEIELHLGIKMVQFLIDVLEKVLLFTKDLSEDGFIQCIKFTVCLNKQFPERESLRSTEVADAVVKVQLKGDEGVANFSQGLLHALNEVGYPNNNSPETTNILKMCLDLTNLNDMQGYFYINDVKILVDIIIRELANMSTTDAKKVGEEESLRVEEIRCLYMRLATLLLAKSGWCAAGASYRIQDVCDALKSIIATYEDVGDEFEGKEVAVVTLETFEQYLQL